MRCDRCFFLIEDDFEEDENIDIQSKSESENKSEENDFEENESDVIESKISSSICLIFTSFILLIISYAYDPASDGIFSIVVSVFNFMCFFMLIWGLIKLGCAFIFKE